MEEFKEYEPKKSNRFIVKVGEPFNIKEYVVNKVELPQYDHGKWTDLRLRMYDPIHPSTSQNIHEGLRKLRTQDEQEITTVIYMLGPVGDNVSQWVIKGHIAYIHFGDLNWSINDTLQINIVIKPSSVLLNY